MKNLCLVLTLIFSQLAYSDVMNLNEFAPTQLEDATTIDEHSSVFQLSGQYEKDRQDSVTWRPVIRYAPVKRTQIEVISDVISGGDEKQSGKVRANFMYLLNESDNAFPMIAINPMVHFPTGKESEGTDIGTKIILTSMLKGSMDRPETQLHLNYQFTHNASRQEGERADMSAYTFGLSRRVRDNMALIIDCIHQEDFEREKTDTYLETGINMKVGQRLILGFAVGAGLGPDTPEWMSVLSSQYEF